MQPDLEKLMQLRDKTAGTPQEPAGSHEPATEADYMRLDEAFRQTRELIENADRDSAETDVRMKAQGDRAVQLLFRMLEDQGVNPGDEAAVTEYLQEIEGRDPQSYMYIEQIINHIMRSQQGLNREPIDVAPTGVDAMQENAPAIVPGVTSASPASDIPQPPR